MSSPFEPLHADDGEPVAATQMVHALTAGTLVFGDGATQVFTADGRTTFADGRRPSRGEWRVVGDGQFESFWPPAYRATYELTWMVDEGAITGLRFVERGRGDRFEGRFR